MKLDKQLKNILREQDLTVAQLSRKTGVSAKTLHNWLDGQRPRDIDAVKKVADQLGVSLDFICYGTVASKSSDQLERHMGEIHAGIFEVVLRRTKGKE